jgi:hypothetical protein
MTTFVVCRDTMSLPGQFWHFQVNPARSHTTFLYSPINITKFSLHHQQYLIRKLLQVFMFLFTSAAIYRNYATYPICRTQAGAHWRTLQDNLLLINICVCYL